MQTGPLMKIVEGLYAKVITCQKQRWSSSPKIADCECKHPIQLLDALRSAFFIGMKYNVGVSLGLESMSSGLQSGSQLGKVVNLAVKSNPDRAVLVAHGHVTAGGQIDDCEPAIA